MKFAVTIEPAWKITRDEDMDLVLPELLRLLTAIDENGRIEKACETLKVSYRHGWGLLRTGEEVFGTPLVNKVRGRGTVLAPLGRKLLWADRRIAARLSPTLDSLASELEAELLKDIEEGQPVLRIHASHGFAVEVLRSFLAKHHMPVDLKYRGSLDSVASLARGDCDTAGFHVPIGTFEAEAWKEYLHWLKPRRHRLIYLAEREQGLFVSPGNPLGVQLFEDLLRDEVTFVNRQSGSGTRMLLDMLLKSQGIDSRRIKGYQNSEFTHAAVAAYIASGMADAGFGIRTAAHRFNLEFIPIARERYFFACNARAMNDARIKGMVDIMGQDEFHEVVNGLPGYRAAGTGTVLTLAEAASPVEDPPAES